MAVNLSTMDFNQLPLVLNQLQQQLTALTDKVNKHDDILARLDALEKENQDLKQQLQANVVAAYDIAFLEMGFNPDECSSTKSTLKNILSIVRTLTSV
ncbi:hypothetical protein PS15m_007929 [Mucor circinelloides]